MLVLYGTGGFFDPLIPHNGYQQAGVTDQLV
jgi:hypothetical protein